MIRRRPTPAAIARADQIDARNRDRVTADLKAVRALNIHANEESDAAVPLGAQLALETCCLGHLADAYARALIRLANTAHTPKEIDR